MSDLELIQEETLIGGQRILCVFSKKQAITIYDGQTPWEDLSILNNNQFVTRITIDDCGKVENVEFGNFTNRANVVNYTVDDAIRIANRESRRKIYFNRLYLTQDISTILTCYRNNTLKYVRLPDMDPDTGRTPNVRVLISNIHMQHLHNMQEIPGIILISYRDRVIGNGHATVLAVDLDQYPAQDSIMCFDSSHAFCKKLGFFNKELNKLHFDRNLQNVVSDKPINRIRMQNILTTKCTNYSEAFMVTGSKVLEDNPNIYIREFKALMNSKQYLKRIEQTKNTTVRFAGNWLQRNIPFMAPRRSRDCVTAGGGISLIPHKSTYRDTKQIKHKTQDKQAGQTKQAISAEKYKQDKEDIKDLEYLKHLSILKGLSTNENSCSYQDNLFIGLKDENKSNIIEVPK